MSTSVQNGVYYITSHYTSTVLTLTSGAEGTNLTAWERYGGPEQQWNVTGLNGLYTFRNIAYGYYASFEGRRAVNNPYTMLWARPTPYRFALQEYRGGYLISGKTVSGHVLNLAGASYANNTPIIFWPLTVHDGPDNAVWFFNSTNPGVPSFPSSGTVKSISARQFSPGLIAGIVTGGLALAALIFFLAFYLGSRHRRYPPLMSMSSKHFSIDDQSHRTSHAGASVQSPVYGPGIHRSMSSVGRQTVLDIRPATVSGSMRSGSWAALTFPRFSHPHNSALSSAMMTREDHRMGPESESYWSAAAPSTIGTIGRHPAYASPIEKPGWGGPVRMLSTVDSADSGGVSTAPERVPTPPPKDSYSGEPDSE